MKNDKEIKYSNSIVVGGPIAVGKSTLVDALPFVSVQELSENDELSNLLLSKMYEGDMIAAQVFQLDILLARFDKYKSLANNKKMHVFDRSIFEDRFFAHKLLKNYKNIWNYYDSIWHDKVKEMITEVGIPKLYICLETDWDSFKKRVFKRNREAEIKNFEKNKEYFRNLIIEYPKLLNKLFKKYKIPYVLIDTKNKSKEDVYKEVIRILIEKGIINE